MFPCLLFLIVGILLRASDVPSMHTNMSGSPASSNCCFVSVAFRCSAGYAFLETKLQSLLSNALCMYLLMTMWVVFKCMYRCVYTCACMCGDQRTYNLNIVSQMPSIFFVIFFPFFFLFVRTSLYWNSASSWLVSEQQGSACLCHPQTGIISM